MKKGYKKLLVFESIFFIILILNSFVINLLVGYKMIIFLLMSIIIFKIFFGIEKYKHRFAKDIILEIIIFLMIFLILYYLLGILVGFIKIDNYLTFYGISNYIIPIICYVLLKEFFRYELICKAEGSKLVTIFAIILMIFLDVTTTIQYSTFSSKYNLFLFISLNLLPAISSNIVFSCITLKVGYKPITLYALVIGLYQYLIPIVPNPNEYIVSIVNLLLPVILGYKIYLFFKNAHDEEIIREYNKKRLSPLIACILFVIFIVYFTSGEFRYKSYAIASGSMETLISRGDVIIIKKIDNDDYDKLKVGQIIAYQRDGVTIIHRLVKIINYQGKYYFYTKGDANPDIDDITIEEEMVVGVAKLKIPYIGLPSVWFSEI